MKKNNEWHYNKDYRAEISKGDGIFVAIALIALFVAFIILVQDKKYSDYNWEYEEYTIGYGDTVYGIEKEYFDTWCTNTGVSFTEYQYYVEKKSNLENVNKVKPGDKLILPINPTKR